MAPSEKLPDAGLGRSRAVGHQHVKVAHEVLQPERRTGGLSAPSDLKKNHSSSEGSRGTSIDGYLEGVLDAVSRLADPDRLQHTCVPELPQHQAVVETQGKLGRSGEDGVNTARASRRRKAAFERAVTFSALERIHLTKYGSD